MLISKNLSLTFEIIALHNGLFSRPNPNPQVLHNLLSNAIKFTHSGEISFRVKTEWEANRIIFTVKDSGRGISLEHQESIFDSFNRLTLSINAQNMVDTGLKDSVFAKDITDYWEES